MHWDFFGKMFGKFSGNLANFKREHEPFFYLLVFKELCGLSSARGFFSKPFAHKSQCTDARGYFFGNIPPCRDSSKPNQPQINADKHGYPNHRTTKYIVFFICVYLCPSANKKIGIFD
ncbi:hypothetical protein CKA38_12975 [Ereboglobus luteus]|uniref:Uncharacterized protein n=1 Tax=Ereboglobus luteus TaxID=1796921 RepID=A0A2U8E5K5_9BACT|nr:hypothetical protein CKA38_12975 [Ereboglobus luteus]